MEPLVADLYELSMAVSYLRRHMSGPATFSLFIRDLPRHRGFLVCAGLADALDVLSTFRLAPEHVRFVGDTLGLEPAQRAHLADLRFTGDVWAIPEGRIVTADEPLLEVTAPIAEAQIVETAMLNLLTFQTGVATKAARCRLAAPDAQLVDFSLRRTQGVDAGVRVARCAAIAGFDATSNVDAARMFGLLPSGTMAHSYVESFETEEAAFRAFASDLPDRCIFLVDTYDTIRGVVTAARVMNEFNLPPRSGIRLDSGDLGALAVQARAVLDAAGRPKARIFASGGLDEYRLAELVAGGAPIDGYGIGTRLGVIADAPCLDSAYKLVQYGDRPVFKLSPAKATLPGSKQVFRRAGLIDEIGLRDEPIPPGSEPLLGQVMEGGERLTPREPLCAAKQRFEADLAQLAEGSRHLLEPLRLQATRTSALRALTTRVGALQAG